MKRLLLSISLITLCGCASMTTEIVSTDITGKILTSKKTKVTSFFSKSTIDGLSAGKETKTGSSLLEVKKSGTETEAEKLNGFIESAARGAAAGVK